jgi:hypothetical protein
MNKSWEKKCICRPLPTPAQRAQTMKAQIMLFLMCDAAAAAAAPNAGTRRYPVRALKEPPTLRKMPFVNLPVNIEMRSACEDVTFKILFGEKGGEHRTISFINSILKPATIQERVVSVQLLPDPLGSVKDRSVHFDVPLACRCATETGKVFILEMQNCAHIRYGNRFFYCCARHFFHNGDIELKRTMAESTEKERIKLRRSFYRDLTPVKIICIMNFDSPNLGHLLGNSEDVVVHWDICERKKHQITNKLQSWTFVVLPRFLKQLNTSKPKKFEDRLEAWLFFMTRQEGERVTVTKNLVANSNEIASAFYRISHLTTEESYALTSLQLGQMTLASRDAQSLEEGKSEGKRELMAELLRSGVINETVFARMSRELDHIGNGVAADDEAAGGEGAADEAAAGGEGAADEAAAGGERDSGQSATGTRRKRRRASMDK